MEAIVERSCGLDVHQATVVACVLVGAPDRRASRETRTFGTTTVELEALRDWLVERGVTHVGMESTGVYWMRYRRKLIEQQTSERKRLMKMLEIGNVKLSSVVSDVFGVSGRAMVRALIEGKAAPEEMARLALGSLRKKTRALTSALRGQLDEHHRFLLRLQLERVERLEGDVATVDGRIDEVLAPHCAVMRRLLTIPGIDRAGAIVWMAEVGPDVSMFPTANHLAAWAGVCPSNSESAGKRAPSGKRTGNVHLTTALVQAAAAASRKKGSYLKEKFWRVKAKRGYKRALVAVAHRIAVAAYHMLRDGHDYRALGAAYLDGLEGPKTRRRLIKRLEAMGYKVTLTTDTVQAA